jgi:hypothetical protein
VLALTKGARKETPMLGTDFVSLLVDELQIKIGPVTKSQWKQKKDISLTVLRNAFGHFEKQKFDEAITPLAEFHKLVLDHGRASKSFASLINSKILEYKLKEKGSVGIYAFYDASGRVVYIGKTEKMTLFIEMQQRYIHKNLSIRVIKHGKSAHEHIRISDVARYFSAYKVSKHLINNVEALLTRIIINNSANIHIERFK